MIGGTNGGAGGLNLRIVDGNTQPARPVENMIWINTETRIPNWYWQADEPTNKELGTLWIGASSVATNVLSLLRHNVLEVGIGTIRQWNGTEWEIVGGKVYYDGTWHNFQTFVYDGSIGNAENNFNHNVGGYPWSRTGMASISTAADSFTCNFGGSTGGSGLCQSNKKIDFTNVKKVKITYTTTASGRSTIHQVRAFSTSGGGGVAASLEFGGSSTKATAELNTASLSGEYYLGFYVYSDVSGYNWSYAYKIYTIELVS